MKLRTTILSVFAIFLLVSCGSEKKAEESSESNAEKAVEPEKEVEEKKEKPAHWSYDGETNPEHWAEIEKDASCGGSHQSPIDIVTADVLNQASGLKASDVHYSEATLIHDVTNNGHSIQYNFDSEDNYVEFEGKRYDLKQFHFHAASEHSVDGMHYPLVIHFVNMSEDKNFVVFAVMVEEGEALEGFDFIESYLPVQPGETKPVNMPHNFSHYFQSDFAHYNYQGSLTTPPCTEAVNWFVFKSAISASPEQVKKIADLMPRNNYRPTQPLNDRVVLLSE